MMQPEGGTMSKVLEVCMLLADENIALRAQLEEERHNGLELLARLRSEESKAYNSIEQLKEGNTRLHGTMRTAKERIDTAIQHLITATKQVQPPKGKKKVVGRANAKVRVAHNLLQRAIPLLVDGRRELITGLGANWNPAVKIVAKKRDDGYWQEYHGEENLNTEAPPPSLNGVRE